MTLRTRWRSARALLGLKGDSEPHSETTVSRDVPVSVAIIMDGNARWAQKRHLPVAAGHRAGAQALKRVVRAASDAGIEDLTVFSFSTENWSRPQDEVDDLMVLFTELIDRETEELNAENVRMRFIGRLDALPDQLRRRIDSSQTLTAANSGLTLFVAMNYGGRGEILDAAKRLVAENGPDASEEDFRRLLYGPQMRDPELVIRTSGEQRLSNFLLWQSAYSELFFSDRLWPDFGPDDLDAALAHYAGCQRRFGAR
jgi:undecaprenyl diphosphate synthase